MLVARRAVGNTNYVFPADSTSGAGEPVGAPVSTPNLVPEGRKFIKAVYTYAALRTPHTHYNQNAQQA